MHTLSRNEMILRAVRAAVRDHARKDYLAVELPEIDGDFCRTRSEQARERIEDMQWRKPNRARHYPGLGDQERRPVADALSDAEVLGTARELDPKYARHGAIVVRVRYAKTWLADYEVSPDPSMPALCWAD
jgi:hypothetical protein